MIPIPGFRSGIVPAIILKDIKEFSRDRLWMILTPLSLVFVIAVFMLVPDAADREIDIGLYPSDMIGRLGLPSTGLQAGPSFILRGFQSEDSLEEAVFSGRDGLWAGLALPEDFLNSIATGERVSVRLYIPASLPPGIPGAVFSAVHEAGYAVRAALRGEDPLSALPVRLPDLGTMFPRQGAGSHGLSISQRLRPMLVVLILLIESLALAGLVSAEIEVGTASALLVTPARTRDILWAKCLLGVILASVQAFVFLLATGASGVHWPLVIFLLTMGACLATAVGLLCGAGGRDFIGTMFIGLLFLVPLMLPVFWVMLPGRPPLPVRLIPSYGLVRSLVGVLGEGRGWAFASRCIPGTAVWSAGLLSAALLTLKRKLESP